MRFFRLVMALLLIAALPAYGWASLGLPGPCAMEQMPMAAMPDSADPCCSGAMASGGAEQGGSGQLDLCKTGQACQGSSLHHLPSTLVPQLADLTQSIGWARPSLHAGVSPPALWRPPRFL